MKFKLHGRAIRPAEYPEQVECFQFDPSQIAVMCFSHTSSTICSSENGLQNCGGFIVPRESWVEAQPGQARHDKETIENRNSKFKNPLPNPLAPPLPMS